jgi:hypothetical protein
MNLYFKFWAEAITRAKKNRKDAKNLLFILSFVNGMNLYIIAIWLKYFNVEFIPKLTIDLFPGDILDGALCFFVEFILVFVVLNYFLIFKNKYFLRHLDGYKVDVNYPLYYSVTVMCTAFVSAMVYIMLD